MYKENFKVQIILTAGQILFCFIEWDLNRINWSTLSCPTIHSAEYGFCGQLATIVDSVNCKPTQYQR